MVFGAIKSTLGMESGAESSNEPIVDFETGLVKRISVATPKEMVYLGDEVSIAGGHKEEYVEARQGYSTLGSGGSLTYPERSYEYVLVTEEGERIGPISEKGYERLNRIPY